MTAPEPIHPGEHLADFTGELDITQYSLAKTIGARYGYTILSAVAGPSLRTRRSDSVMRWE